MNPLETRRREDLRRVRALCERSGGKLVFVGADAEAPNEVRLRLNVRTALDSRYPARAGNTVDLRIVIPAGYPFRSGPTAFLTPAVWHPNVFPSGQVCQGSKWLVSEFLDLYVSRILRIVTFQDDVLNLQSVANASAAVWYRQAAARSPGLFPTDRVDALRADGAADGAAGVVWNDAS